MSDDVKKEISQSEMAGAPPAKQSKKRTCARHCKRFWWIYLIVFCCVVVLVVCLVIFVGVPKIAQHKMDEAELDIQGVHVLDTTSDTYLMEINSTITTDGKIKANIDPFEGSMYLEDYEPQVAFAQLDFPATTADKHQIVNISQSITIADMDAFTRFNVWFHNNETLRVTIQGKTKVKPSGLSRKSSVDFKKTMEIKGLNVFAGTEVSDGHISLEADENGKNFNGTAKIPNASHFTLDIGNCTFDNFVGDVKVGTLFIDNLLLVPGENVVPITATMDQVEVLKLARQRPYCESGIIPFKLLGTDVTNRGQKLSYFAAALASKNQTVDIDIGSIIEKDLGARVGCASDS